jgi:hypothetical protein
VDFRSPLILLVSAPRYSARALPGAPVVAPFDIFCVQSDGRLLWRSAAEDLEAAQRRVRILMASEPGDYVICSQETGEKTVVRAEIQHARPNSSAH